LNLKAIVETASTIPQPAAVPTAKPDLTGRSRLVSNVLFTWGGQMVFFVSGFIMPRMIDRVLGGDDRVLGKEVLGIWDFSWSLVMYFRFVDMGITASVNRFVARYWGKQDIEGINRVISSATLALVIGGVIVLLGTIVAVVSLPYWFGTKLHGYVSVTQLSVLWLGVMLAVGTALGAYNGVLTGCHRWELQTMRNSLWQFIAVAGMLIALWLGGGLVMLAAITAICQILGQLTMVGLAYKACPGLKIKRSYVHWGTIKELYIYSGKALLPTFSEMLLNQTTSVLIVGGLGPAALAVFTRPRALLRQLDSLERKMAMILIPTTSSLEVCGHLDEIKNLLVKSVRYSIYLVLPMVMILFIFGDKVMLLWMGPGYANWTLPAIMAIGFLGTCIQTPILYMLEGLNAHGRGGVGQFVGSAISAVAVFVAFKFFHAGLTAAAVAVTVPLLIVNLWYLPMLLCRRLQQSMGKFYSEVVVGPVIHVLPFTICLVVGRLLFKSYPVPALGLCAVGGVTLAIFYWHKVLPEKLKAVLHRRYEKIVCRFGFFGANNSVK
jgi:O-antigen/teichoic acid export membrane protein